MRKFFAFLRDNSWTYNGGLVTLLTVSGILRIQLAALFIFFIGAHALFTLLAGDE